MILLHLLRFGADEEKMGEGRRGGGGGGGGGGGAGRNRDINI